MPDTFIPTSPFIVHSDALTFLDTLEDGTIDLLLMDPPYFNTVKDKWDQQWASQEEFVEWFLEILRKVKPKMKPQGSVIFFGGIGKHGQRPLFKIMEKIESENLFYARNMITWKKKRGYGKMFDYLFIREEICWYSVSPVRTEVTFNIPLLEEKRGYPGWNKLHPAKSEFKRRGNVFTDINELFRVERSTQKPLPLMKVLVETHSNPGDLVVDLFCGWGTTGLMAVKLGRRFLGCEAIKLDAETANERIIKSLE